GATLWRARIGAMGSGARSSLAMGPGAIYASSSDGNIVALNDATGAILWRHRADPATAPSAAAGVGCVNTIQGDLPPPKANNGMQLWSAQVHGLLAAFGDPRPLAVAGGVFEGVSGACLVICREAYVYALRASDGAVAWRVLTPHILTALVV